MQRLGNIIDSYDKNDLKKEFYNACKEEGFKELISTLSLKEEDLMKYTSLLQDSSKEYMNCKNCKGLGMCKNEVKGFAYLPYVNDGKVLFAYTACRYKQKEEKNNEYKNNISFYDMPKELENAKMKDIYLDDKSRTEVLKYIDNYNKKYGKEDLKGIYLHGNFGSGKTYIIAALFNELAKKEVKSAIIYYPEFLRSLKESFVNQNEDNNTFKEKYNYIKTIPLLLIDDIGAENVTAWSRDEILGTLLQYRMENHLQTFFTSNLSIEELEQHLSMTKDKIDKVKSRRIIERIKVLTNDIELIGKSRR